jgi:tetratricopeptide (TPR) repeat protein
MDVVQHAEKWLSAHPAGPHFVWVHLYDPHDPYEPPPPYADKYKDRPYDGEIAYADSALGHYVNYLKQRPWYDNSLVIVVGDHGEGLGEHHEETHGIFLYDSTLHVPLIVKLPGKQGAGKKVAAQVRTTDILPTVLETVGVSRPAELHGKSLQGYFSGRSEGDRTAFGETDYPLRFGWAPLKSVREGEFKFIEAPRPELYDLRSDPGELHNQYSPSDPTVQKLRAAMAELRGKQPNGPQASADALSSTMPSPLPDPKDKIDEQNLLHKAMLASEDNRVGDARSALEKVLQLDSKSPTALLQLGQLELNAGNGQRAADYLKRARELRSDDAAAALYHGQALNMTGDFAAARDALEQSLQLQPSQFAARLLLGRVYLKLGNAKAAEDQLQAALLLKPENPEAQLELARAMIANQEFSEAERQLRALARSQPENADVYELLGQALAGSGKKEEAEEARQRAKKLRADPGKKTE